MIYGSQSRDLKFCGTNYNILYLTLYDQLPHCTKKNSKKKRRENIWAHMIDMMNSKICMGK